MNSYQALAFASGITGVAAICLSYFILETRLIFAGEFYPTLAFLNSSFLLILVSLALFVVVIISSIFISWPKVLGVVLFILSFAILALAGVHGILGVIPCFIAGIAAIRHDSGSGLDRLPG